MKIVYGKQLTEQENLVINNISAECGILYDTARLLFYRNIDTVPKAKAFLNPGKHAFHNPLLLSGMIEAVERLNLAKDNNENVLIFGDYDADGVCATTVLYKALNDFGIKARKFVPEREDNYGLNLSTVNEFNNEKNIHLLITVDCGISEYEKIEEIKKLGIDVIVTDHHEPPEILPDCIRINPKIAGQEYPFKELCGAGVAYKLAYSLIGERADEYLDFVALATVADSMDLVGENRDIVAEGLTLFNSRKTLRPAFRNLITDLNKQVTAQTLAFTVAPRINAGGRMGDANAALRLFTTDNENDIFDLSVKLESYNTARQAECDKIYHEAKAKIEAENLRNDDVVLVAGDSWRTGFIGIVAARLVEDYSRPVIVFAGCDDYYKGSARSVEEFNIYDAINSAKDLLLTYGGHSQAAGVSVSKENFNILRDRLNAYAKSLDVKMSDEAKIYAEWQVENQFSMRFAKELELLEPFGVGNRKPLFSTKVFATESRPLKLGSPHYFFKTDAIEILDFNGEKNVFTLSYPIVKDVVFEINLSTYKNRESLKGYLKCVCPVYETTPTQRPYLFCAQLEKAISNPKYMGVDNLELLSVDREDFKRIFNSLKELSGKYFLNAVAFSEKYLTGENLYQAIFAINVFVELGIFSIKGGKFNLQEKVKNALTNSRLYSKIYSLKSNEIQ